MGLASDDFKLLKPLTSLQAEFSFAASFQGREVEWQVYLEPLSISGGKQQCIDISQIGDDQFYARVRLNVPGIDIPTVRKTVLMLRNYKRLHLGRHEFAGPAK